MKEKSRLDVFLAHSGLCSSREEAKALIIAGEVMVNGQTVTTPSFCVTSGQNVQIKQRLPFVSRGGLKLDKAVRSFDLRLDGLCCADLGASTGGFTDCMLQNGAKRVYAVDVGYGQLAYTLRNDPRVVVLERTNARYLEQLPEPVDFAAMDLSFISILQVLPAAMRISKDDAPIVALVKPQFEAGREKVGKKGVVRDPRVHLEVLERVSREAQELGLGLCDLTFSPIKGPNGNVEFPALFRRGAAGADRDLLQTVVESAHRELKTERTER